MSGFLFRGAHLSLGEATVEALDNLLAQGQRSALALLGIMIGAASVVAVLSIGHMAQIESLKTFHHLGADVINVHAEPAGMAPVGILDRNTVDRLPSLDPAVLKATGFVADHDKVASGTRNATVAIGAVEPSLTQLVRLQLREGRFIEPIDDNGLVAVVGSKAADKLSSPGAPITTGSRITMKGYLFTVIGVLDPAPFTPLDAIEINDAMMIPLSGSGRVFPSPQPTGALVRLRSSADADAAAKRISALLDNPTATLTVLKARDMIRTMNAQKAIHNRLLAAVGAISLLVGGIGVMNVMLMGVMERRREIGLRAAVGATPGDIGLMFLVEAAALAFVGGLAGLVLGVLTAFIAARLSGWTFNLALWMLPLGPGVATMVGVSFGLYPAITASRLSPIDALRAE